VHAVGEGVLLAEIQQTSDITFRLYDWDRPGTDGLPRQLHVREALECVDFTRGPILPLRPRTLSGISSNRVEEIVAGEHFVIRRHQGSQPWDVETRGRFGIFVVLEGQVDLLTPTSTETLVRGETVLIPADSDKCRIKPQGEATLLETFVPNSDAV
ncbi:MAG: gmuF, partial [Planctomycetaceae bacterium]|nr:gmuF [Planctomycetaceae bacterium]